MLTFTNINLTAGQVLRIDTEQRTATVGDTNVLNKLSSTSKWFNLENGANEIELTGTGTVTIKTLWRDKWI